MISGPILRISLPIYFLIFFGYVFLYRSRQVSKNIGKSTMVLPKDGSSQAMIGLFFKIVHYGSVVFCLAFAAYPMLTNFLGELGWMTGPVFKYIGSALLILAFIITVMAQNTMRSSWRMGIDNETGSELITNGLFAYSRNPVFVGLIMCFLGLFLIVPNALTLLFVVLEYVLIQIQIRVEESHLEKSHGVAYVEYRSKTRRLI